MSYYAITIAQKRALSALLARRKGGHGQFGRVLMRKPYREDEDEGGSHGLPSPFEQHPLLSDLPIGASSDLTSIVSERRLDEMLDEAAERGDQLNPQLQQQPVMQAKLQQQKSFVNSPSPYR